MWEVNEHHCSYGNARYCGWYDSLSYYDQMINSSINEVEDDVPQPFDKYQWKLYVLSEHPELDNTDYRSSNIEITDPISVIGRPYVRFSGLGYDGNENTIGILMILLLLNLRERKIGSPVTLNRLFCFVLYNLCFYGLKNDRNKRKAYCAAFDQLEHHELTDVAFLDLKSIESLVFKPAFNKCGLEYTKGQFVNDVECLLADSATRNCGVVDVRNK